MINLIELEKELRLLKPRSKLFRILKKELSILGYWKCKPRGNPKKGFEISRMNQNVG